MRKFSADIHILSEGKSDGAPTIAVSFAGRLNERKVVLTTR